MSTSVRFVTPSRGLPPCLTHERESVGPPHRRKPAGECDSAFERHAVGFDVLRQRPVFLLAPAPAPTRVLVLVAAGFFSFSAPMLARSASMRLITRRGAGPSSRTGSIARPSRARSRND